MIKDTSKERCDLNYRRTMLQNINKHHITWYVLATNRNGCSDV